MLRLILGIEEPFTNCLWGTHVVLKSKVAWLPRSVLQTYISTDGECFFQINKGENDSDGQDSEGYESVSEDDIGFWGKSVNAWNLCLWITDLCPNGTPASKLI